MSANESIQPDEAYAVRLAARDDAVARGEDTPKDGPPDELCRRLDGEVPFLKMLRQALVPSVPPKALGRFQIRRELGRGGYGLVYLAYDPRLDRDIALKVPRADTLVTPALRERFLREARAAAVLDHPNIVPVHEAGEIGPVCYITYAYCPGPTLAAWLRDRAEPVPPKEAAALVATLAEAVDHAHTRGVIHRDLKPANILLATDQHGSTRMKTEREKQASLAAFSAIRVDPCSSVAALLPKITDFGLARRMEETGQTASGDVLGTPSYMAPEQAAGRGKAAGPAADIYSLGAILYELLTGRPPFQTATVLETLRLVLEEEPVPPRRLNPVVPRDLETICLKCLQKEPAWRYENAWELAADLRRFGAHEPVRARPVGRLERSWRWCRRQPALAGLLGAVALLAVGLLVLLAAGWENFNRLQAKTLQDRLLEATTEDVPVIIRDMQPYRRWLNTTLREAYAEAEARQDARKQLHASLALLPVDADQVDYLVGRLLAAEPQEVVVIRAALRPYADGLTEKLWEVLQDTRGYPGPRLRAAAALADYVADDGRWEQVCGDVAARLVAENFLVLGKWAEALKPVRRQLLVPLAAILSSRRRDARRLNGVRSAGCTMTTPGTSRTASLLWRRCCPNRLVRAPPRMPSWPWLGDKPTRPWPWQQWIAGKGSGRCCATPPTRPGAAT